MQHDSLWLVCIVLFLPASVIFASDTIIPLRTHGSHYEYQVNSGYMNYSSLDVLYSDNVYSGGNLFYEIGFGIRNKILIMANANFSLFDRKPKSLELNASVVPSESRFSTIHHFHFELDNSYGFHILKNRFKDVKLYVTGNWFTSGEYVTNSYMIPELLMSSIALGFYGEYRLKIHLFYLRCFSSLLSYTCRDNYSFARSSDYEEFGPLEFLKENSHIQFPNSLFTMFTKTGWRIHISDHFCLLLDYHFRYLKDTEPRLLKSVTSIYSIGLLYRVVKR